MSTFINNVYYLDDQALPYELYYTNLAQYHHQGDNLFTEQCSVNHTPTVVEDKVYQIYTGQVFLLKQSNKFLGLPWNAQSFNTNLIKGRTLIIQESSLQTAHTIATYDGTLIGGKSSFTLLPKQTIQLLYTGTGWEIVSSYIAL